MAANTGANLKGLRDRALLLIGFAGALRRSELVALNIEDIETLTPRLDGGRSPEWPAAAHAGGKTDNQAHRPRPAAPPSSVMNSRRLMGAPSQIRQGADRNKQPGRSPDWLKMQDSPITSSAPPSRLPYRLPYSHTDGANKTSGLHKLLHCVGAPGENTLRACWNQLFPSRPYSLRRLSASLFSSP
jgi:hypothetical protein